MTHLSPADRPLLLATQAELTSRFEHSLHVGDGLEGAHCIHELWMRGAIAVHITAGLDRLWQHAADSIPEWLPTRHIEWLPLAYQVSAQFKARKRGRTNVYLILLDYSDSRDEPHGVYVGMTRYQPAERYDQHKAGIRAAGSVLRRGLEVLTGPTLHLQYISRADATRIEAELAEALRVGGLLVHGGR